jgi:peptidoglycan/LPS O-acetylase OafA/YrhL
LDGLRAVAVGLVIFAHFGFLLSMPSSVRKLLSPVILNDGVELFFVLSGFLITTILLRERAKTGQVSLRRFYARRAFRIMPAFYAFLLVVGILSAVGVFHVSAADLLLAGVYTWDYVPRAVPWIQHTWSLAIEEQFYLVWPMLLVRGGRRAALTIAVAVVCVEPFVRLVMWRAFPADVGRLDFMAHDRADALLIGCAIALLPTVRPDMYRRLVDVTLRYRLDAVAAAYFFIASPYLISVWPDPTRWLSLRFAFGGSLAGLSAAVLVVGLIERKSGTMVRTLQNSWLRHLGILSYSLYLWQELFFVPQTHLAWPLRFLGTLGAAEISYWVVERPFLRRKRRFEPEGVVADEDGSAAPTPVSTDDAG